MKVSWNVPYLLRSVQGWFRYGVRFCLGLVGGGVQGRFEIVVKIDLRFSLGGFCVITLGLFNVGVMFILHVFVFYL